MSGTLGFIGGFLITLVLAIIAFSVWYFAIRKEKECPPPVECPEPPPQIPNQYFIAKKCPNDFIHVANLNLAFKNGANFSEGFEYIAPDEFESGVTWRKVNLCAGILQDIQSTISDTSLYSFISKNSATTFMLTDVASVRFMYEASYSTLPFTAVSSTAYSTNLLSNGVLYKYVEAKLVPAAKSDYVLTNSCETGPKLGLHMDKNPLFTGFTTSSVITSTMYDLAHPCYAVRFGVSDRKVEGFELNPYTLSPIVYNNQVNLVNLRKPTGEIDVDHGLKYTTMQFTAKSFFNL